jgi:hypothetical protein
MNRPTNGEARTQRHRGNDGGGAGTRLRTETGFLQGSLVGLSVSLRSLLRALGKITRFRLRIGEKFLVVHPRCDCLDSTALLFGATQLGHTRE